jgi:hypothetical protein
MSNGKSCLTLALEQLAAAGVHHPEVARGAKHLQLRWFTPRGERRCFAVSGTPSDWRTPQNTARDLRRVLREDGMLLEETPSPKTPPSRQPSELELLKRRVGEIERRLGIGVNVGVVKTGGDI